MELIKIDEALRSAASRIDITSAMYEEAVAHYQSVATYLDNRGLPVQIRPYGSILSGTPVRPLADDEDGYFDIDMAVIVSGADIGSSPEAIRSDVQSRLEESDRYKGMLTVDDMCITVEYVANGTQGGFRLDLASCVANPDCARALSCRTAPRYSKEATAIARRSGSWVESNPEGLGQWFLDINEGFAEAARRARKSTIAAGSPLYASVDPVPDQLYRSNLQCAVQIAKRSRDVYYLRADHDDRPGSFVLLILFGFIAEQLAPNSSIYDILASFVSNMREARTGALVSRSGMLGCSGEWSLENPVFGENVISGWTNSEAATFFRWVDSLGQDLENLLRGGFKASASLESMFGRKIGNTAYADLGMPAIAAATQVSPRKPWGLYD
ncbi:nucleotidyltransferase domain-containing protein [Adlercreutzia caecimuris]|uniref:nucleotidyltransferase domain-containing protein n=1 Tax=Adlercreutzia caecimuris TaxID=671266 RepID=UPI00272CDD9C|nr:nucleotidyltransferase [Adlercreutzia caecimuris]